jgi:hypothetical protein
MKVGSLGPDFLSKPHPSSLGAILGTRALASRPSLREGDQLFQSAARARTRWIRDGWAESKQARVERPSERRPRMLSYAA